MYGWTTYGTKCAVFQALSPVAKRNGSIIVSHWLQTLDQDIKLGSLSTSQVEAFFPFCHAANIKNVILGRRDINHKQLPAVEPRATETLFFFRTCFQM